MFQAAEAARYIDEAHRTRAPFRNLPEAIAPGTAAEAYAAQAALCELWGPRLGPVAGLKIATTTKVMQQLMGIGHPCMGIIFAARIYASPATIAKADYVNLRIECELGVRLGRDLPNAAAPYTRESVRPAVSEVMAAFELIEDRGAEYKSTRALSLIADNAWNGGIVIGWPMPLPAGLDLNGIAGALRSNGKEIATGKTDDPLGALAWLATQAVECGRPMMAGMVVITGSVIPTVDIAVGERLDFALDGIGATSLTAT
ncbi:MAG TPA: fumarylacetoacetate hydrolase family protein [Hyphomicrobiaceae bacterium]|nr:fumarylacetoacetate hydrolase family protein [Hyphomicrobiaceae bacterium]